MSGLEGHFLCMVTKHNIMEKMDVFLCIVVKWWGRNACSASVSAFFSMSFQKWAAYDLTPPQNYLK